MPELPELDAAVAQIDRLLTSRRLHGADVAAISVLKTADPPLADLTGRELTGVSRRGKHLLLDLEGTSLVMHLARAGWLRHHAQAPAGAPGPRKGPLAVRMVWDDGSALDVTEQGTRKAVALWASANPEELETLARLGPEADALDEAAFRGICAGTHAHLKTVLTDQTLMAGIGSAWSDEVLHTARLSPFAAADGLDREAAQRLHAALREVLDRSAQGLRDLPLDRIKRAKKSLLRVHGRAGEDCPRCGTTIAEVSFAERSLQYCPTCQTGGRRLSDRRMDRLLR
ncbi:Fpg/Nei family DNA glycosylase [Brachybacterium kimchii]|uniref:Fpg/Nei family DNA glycosylase n=1 Tax=Brachybacterium kimchii TaxID=2942909 RepID=A0ABY4N0S9_9MICO|nr:DNA-formamidopyrimidine glycosylase family protein [Brachybacterium kimchii]UQN28157.1 Fpg/Nei family DNA glycosylase [Brachybacterium kimchii]